MTFMNTSIEIIVIQVIRIGYRNQSFDSLQWIRSYNAVACRLQFSKCIV